jgi:hypothetical protein
MTNRDHSPLTDLHHELDRLTHEVEELAASLDGETRLARRLAGEEAVGAELLATRDLVAHLGIAWDTAEQLGDIYVRQLRLLMDDYRTTAAALLSSEGLAPLPQVVNAHLDRRLRHAGEGLEQGIEVFSRQSAKACGSLLELWAPFLAVVRSDWMQRRGSPQQT